MKSLIKILPVLLVLVYLILAFGFTSDERKNVICNDVRVIIEDSLSRCFYSKNDIRKIINNSGAGLKGYPVSSINTRKLEELFTGKPYISSIDIYTTMQGSLTVRVTQREPVVRIFTGESRSYYLDKEGNIMPESRKFAPFVLVANGYFPGGTDLEKSGNINNVSNKNKYKAWFDVLELVKNINKDDFWKSQIVQVYLNRNGKFELVPRVGAHLILLGEISEMEEKLDKLKILYMKGFPFEGWNNYEKIDLRYKNQIVCTKR